MELDEETKKAIWQQHRYCRDWTSEQLGEWANVPAALVQQFIEQKQRQVRDAREQVTERSV